MMNRIYKVVWSQVKNCYTVVSEIANSHIRGGNRSRMGVVMLAVTVLTRRLRAAIHLCRGCQGTGWEEYYRGRDNGCIDRRQDLHGECSRRCYCL